MKEAEAMKSFSIQAPKLHSFGGNGESKINPAMDFRELGNGLVLMKRMATRRSLLHLIVSTSISLTISPLLLAAQFPDMIEPPQLLRTQKLASGVRIQDIVEGEGPEAREGDLVEVNYVCRRSNGYFVHSTVDQFSGESAPVVLSLDEKQIINGLKHVLIGMKVGGKRRALIPPSEGYVNEKLGPIPEEFGPRRSLLSHANEPLIFEIKACPFCSGFF